MKLNCLLIFTALLFFGSINGQLTFRNGYKKVGTGGTGTATTTSNGIIINMRPTTKAGFVLSDSVIVTQAPLTFYVTLLGCNTATDFGLQIGNPGNYYSGADGAESLIGWTPVSPMTGKRDFLSLEYPGPITGTTTTSPYKPALNQVIKFKLTQDSGSSKFKVEIQDYATGAYLMSTPTAYTAQSGIFDVNTNFNFGFEVLNKGQAIFCVQTDLQVQAAPGDCDGGQTTSDSLSTFTTSTDYSYSTPCDTNSPFFFKDECYQICPIGYNFAYNKACNQGCDSSVPFSDKNFLCYTACPALYPNRWNYECYDVCPVAAPFLQNKICYSTCPGGQYGYNQACISACPAAAINTYQYVCYGKCPETARYNYNTVCNTACPIAHPFYDENYICQDSCPVGTNRLGSHCYSRCPLVAPYAYGGNCLAACPAGFEYFDFYKNCYSSCSTGVPATPNYDSTKRCYSTCPITAPYLNGNLCDTSCPAGYFHDVNKVCHASCSTVVPAAPYADSTNRCYSTCPATAPYQSSDQCLTACPAGTEYYDSNKVCHASCISGAPLTPYFDSTKRCQASCPAATPKIYNSYDCRATCPDDAKFSDGNTCVVVCPSDTPYAYNGNCLSDCPKRQPYFDANRICYYTCPNSTPNVYNRRCYSTCPTEAPYKYKNQCYVRCPSTAPYYIENTCDTKCAKGKVCDKVQYNPVHAEESGLTGWKLRLAIGVPAILGGALILGAIAKIIQIKTMQAALSKKVVSFAQLTEDKL